MTHTPLRRRVIITGGARGIGRRIAERCADDGADVVLLDLPTSQGARSADDLAARFIPVDLSDAVAARTAVEEAVDALGGVDLLVNNAGRLELAPLLETTTDSWDAVFATNARSMLITTQVAGRAMIAAGRGGSIVNVASMAAKTGGAGEGAYAASKAAVVALTRVTALELGCHGIRANALCPGYVLTDMGAATRTDEQVRSWSGLSPLGRLGTPDDVAGFVAFLASPDAGYLTGQAFNVTGGMVMH